MNVLRQERVALSACNCAWSNHEPNEILPALQ